MDYNSLNSDTKSNYNFTFLEFKKLLNIKLLVSQNLLE